MTVPRVQDGARSHLRLGSAEDAGDLAAYLGRLMRYEPLCTVRLRARGAALGVFARPPFGVLVLRVAGLADPVELDATVPAGVLARGLGDGQLGLELPADVPGSAWAGVLPPIGGWRQIAEVPAEPVRAAVARGVGEFRAAVETLPEDRRGDRGLLDRLAASTWDRPVVAGVPLRAAHAALSLGFLTGETVGVLSSGPWTRLDGGAGTAFVRRAGATALQLA